MALDRDDSILVEGVFRMIAYSPGPKAREVARNELPKYIRGGKLLSTESVCEMLACNPGIVSIMQSPWVSSLLVWIMRDPRIDSPPFSKGGEFEVLRHALKEFGYAGSEEDRSSVVARNLERFAEFCAPEPFAFDEL